MELSVLFLFLPWHTHGAQSSHAEYSSQYNSIVSSSNAAVAAGCRGVAVDARGGQFLACTAQHVCACVSAVENVIESFSESFSELCLYVDTVHAT